MSFRYVKLPEVPARKFLPYPYLGLQDWDENTWIYITLLIPQVGI